MTLSADGQTAVSTRWRGTSSGTVKTGRCPPGFVATGFKGRQGDVADRLNGIYCKSIDNLNSSVDSYVAIDAGGWGGNEIIKKCPNGSAISQMDTGDAQFAGKTRPVNIKFGCRKYNPDASSTSTGSLRIGDGSSSWWAGHNPATQYWYADALNVTADNYVAGLKLEARNFSKQLDARTDQVEKAKCAIGTRSSNCYDITPGSSNATSYMANYCSQQSNVGSAECKIWCKQYPQFCDAAVANYCVTNPNDPYCSCINSPAKGIAKCVDSACLNSGYIPTNMANTACPDVVTCTVQANMANAGKSLVQTIPVEQNCGGSGSIDVGNNTGGNTGNNTGGSTDGNTNTNPGTNTGTNSSVPSITIGGFTISYIYLFIFIIVIAVFAAIIYRVKFKR